MAKSTNVGAVDVELGLNSSNYDKQLNNKVKGTESAFSSAFGKIAKVVGGAFAVKQVANFTKNCIDSASKVQSAFTGLNSIVQGTGNSFSLANDFIKKYTSDGLVSIEETATAYKNLLSRGYNSSQIEDVLSRLKDSAAFGRQASYDLGEAVVTATEGLKNENSILVDNAGVTKNVAKMWEEYAKSVGKSSTALTQQEKIQAEYKGIMNETKFQVGDAANYTKTFAGQIQQLKFNFNQMTVAIGKVVTPLAQLFIPAINTAITAVTRFFEKTQAVLSVFGLKMPEVITKTSDSLTGVGESSKSAAKDAVNSAKKMNKAFSGLDEISVISTKSNSENKSDSSGTSGVSKKSESIVEDNGITNSISSIADKIMKYINPLKSISFDNLIKAFDKLKNALKPYTKGLFNGLEWFYFNILVPFSKWTIKDLIPSFFNALAGALNFLSPILKGIKEVLIQFWDKFLQPVASWTGGVIADVLNAIGNALNWISQNETATAILENVGRALGEVLTLGIMMLIAPIKLLMDTIDLLIENWGILKDSAITAWNNIKEKWNIAANWFNTNVVVPIKNLFSPMINWFTELFGSIWQTTSDIFDNIVGIITGTIETIKIIFNAIGGWFDEKVLMPLKNKFSTVFEPLKENAKQAWEGIKSVFSSTATFFKNTFQSAWEKVKQVFSAGGRIFDGIKDGIVIGFKTIVNALISGINKVVSIPFNSINKVLQKIKDVNILGVEPFKKIVHTINVPQIPMLAQGGYAKANNPQLAIIGDNKREGEIVSPESKIYEQTLKAIKDSGTTGKQEIEITIYHKYEDGRTIIQKINQAQIDAGKLLLIQ